MKKDSVLTLPLKIASAAYLLWTALGVLFYTLLPPCLNAFGAQMPTYLFYYAVLGAHSEELTTTTARILFAVAIVLFVLAMVLIVYSLVKKKYQILLWVVATDIILTLAFLIFLCQQNFWSITEYQSGIILNMVFCFFLCRRLFKTKEAESTE